MTSLTSDPEGGLSSPLVQLMTGYEHEINFQQILIHFNNVNYFVQVVLYFTMVHLSIKSERKSRGVHVDVSAFDIHFLDLVLFEIFSLLL